MLIVTCPGHVSDIFALFLTYLIFFPGKQCLAVTKQWLPDTNFNNPANWNKGRVPCDGDNVQLARVSAVIYVDLVKRSLSLESNRKPVPGQWSTSNKQTNHVTSMSSKPEPVISYVILVSRYLDLTGVN